MFKKVANLVQYILITINVVVILVMLVLGNADMLNPANYTFLSIAQLAFPMPVVLNLCFFFMWLVIKPVRVLIPIVGFALAFVPIRTYCPLNPPTKGADLSDAIHVVSFNAMSWSRWESGNKEGVIANKIADIDADILCVQEGHTSPGKRIVIDSILQNKYPYSDTARVKKQDAPLFIYSKYPVLSHEGIPYESDSNLSVAFFLKIDADTVLVVNNHFESNCLIQADRDDFGGIVKGEVDKDSVRKKSEALYDKVAAATVRRGPQADSVYQYLKRHEGMKTILCGDFNDGPNSYVHRKISKALNDCYVEAGFGPGTSYHEGYFYFRIDYIFCSNHYETLQAKVIKDATLSDHYPVEAYIKLKNKTK